MQQHVREKMSFIKTKRRENPDCNINCKCKKTCRLIKNGALAEKYLNCENMNPVDFELMLKKIVGKAAE